MMGSDGSRPAGQSHILRGLIAAWLAALPIPPAVGAETAAENRVDLSLQQVPGNEMEQGAYARVT